MEEIGKSVIDLINECRPRKPISITVSETGCWIPVGFKPNGGSTQKYINFWANGKMWKLHRLSYELEYGPIAPGHDIDHLCGTPTCCRPDHLQAISVSDHRKLSWVRRKEAKLDKQVELPLAA